MAFSAAAGLLACVIAAAACACTIEGAVGHDPRHAPVVADVPDRFRSSLDLLFVVDNTDDAAGLQAGLASLLGEVFDAASLTDDGVLDLHVGVVSSDLGSGASAVTGCTATGDDGALRRPAPDDPACADLGDAWLELHRDGNVVGGNVPGIDDPVELDAALQRAFACLSRIGTTTCSYPQPLAAVNRALAADHPANRGFLRDDTALGVVFVSGEDDCSAERSSLFDASGESARFRCFDRGVTCEGDDVGVVLGPQRGCRPSVDSEVLDISAPAEALRELRAPDALVVTGAVGDTGEITVSEGTGGMRALAPACQRDGGALYPAVRLGSFVSQFAQSAVLPMCDTGPQGLARPTGAQLRRALGHRCLAEHIRDLDDVAPGIQWDCTVAAVAPDDTHTTLSACDRPDDELSSPGPCFAIRSGTCPDFPSGLAVYVNWGEGRGREAPAGMRIEVSCLVDDPP